MSGRAVVKRVFRRLRGLIGMSLLGGIAGLLFGLGWGVLAHLGVVARVYDFPLVVQLQVFGTVFGLIGTLVGGGFGLLLTTTSGRFALEDLGQRRVAILGGVAGAGGPLAVLSVIGAGLPIAVAIPVLLIGGGLGALASVGILRVAQETAGPQALDDRTVRELEG